VLVVVVVVVVVGIVVDCCIVSCCYVVVEFRCSGELITLVVPCYCCFLLLRW